MAIFFGPNGIAFCKGGNIYIVERDKGNTIIRKVVIPCSSQAPSLLYSNECHSPSLNSSDTKVNDKYFECIEIAKKYSDLQNIQYYNGRLFKSKERADIIDRLTTPREKHPVTNFTEMRKTIHWLQQKLHTYSLHACADILDPKHEGRDLYEK
jgi:hypothetical protein